jgi:hypothetical protein
VKVVMCPSGSLSVSRFPFPSYVNFEKIDPGSSGTMLLK